MTPREIDALVAEKVMGENEPRYCPDWNRILNATLLGGSLPSSGGNWHWFCDYELGDIPQCEPKRFSTDIAAAWLIQEKHPFTLAPYPDGRWHASNGKTIVYAETAPMALCLAALKAVGVDIDVLEKQPA